MPTVTKPTKQQKTYQNPQETSENDEFIEETLENPENVVFSEDELLRELCRDSLYFFVQEFWGEIVQEDPVWNWHIKALCDEFQRIAQRVFDGLPLDADTTVNISPGSTKTLIASIMFPAWIWTRMPHAVIISASYALEGIADDASSKSRDVIQSEKYQRLFPEIKLREDTNAKANFKNTRGGVRYAFGIGGSVTGKHAHFIIVDDPLNPEQAASEAELTRANRWMERTLPSRKVNKKVCPTILIMQRLHENDPTGARIEREKNGYRHNHWCLPAELTDDVRPEWCRGHYVDGLMDPVRCDAEVLQQVEREQGEYVLASQYHQTPIPEGTAIFHVAKLTIEEAHKVPRLLKEVRAWDKAACLIAGTMVRTDGGLKAIEEIKAGDLVLTRQGYKAVTWAGVSGYADKLTTATFDDGSELTATTDHPIWTVNRGWVHLASLICSRYSQEDLEDTRWGSERGLGKLKPSCSTGFYSRKIQASTTTSRGVKTPTLASGGTTPCTERSTESVSDPSLKDTTFTTRMGTRRITTPTISPPLHGRPTASTTTPLLSGTGLRKPKPCVRGTTRKSSGLQPPASQSKKSASVAVRNSSPSTLIPRGSSGAVVTAIGGRKRKPDVLLGEAGVKKRVVGLAAISLEQPVLVYDLTVEGQHEFFANGVLVHNTEGAGAFTVGFKAGVDAEGHFWILDVVRDRLDSFRRERLIKSTAEGDGRATVIAVEQEPGSGGKHSAQTTVKNLAGYRVIAEPVGKSDGDKVARSYAFSTQVNAGNVSLVKGDWNQALVSEMRFFPFSKFKDQCDAGSLAFRTLCNKRRKLGGGSILRRKAK